MSQCPTLDAGDQISCFTVTTPNHKLLLCCFPGTVLLTVRQSHSIKYAQHDSAISNPYVSSCWVQEARLSQRDRATLLVIEYFAKSLKITQDHSKQHCWVGRVLVFYWNYVCISYRFWDIQRQMAWPWNRGGVGVVQGHWKWCCSIDHMRLSIGPPL